MLFSIRSFRRTIPHKAVHITFIAVCLVTICSIQGCSSLHKDAAILMEGEEYGEAAKVYGRILAQNPNDAHAIVGQNKARMMWIDKTLLDVRMLRMAGQAVPATDLLKKIIDREREWTFYPDGAVQFTQEEETRYSIRLIAAQVDAWQARGHLVKARAYLEGYRQVFGTPKLITAYDNIHNNLVTAAKLQCNTYKSEGTPSQPYRAAFAKRYCDSWGISFNPGFDVSRMRAASLFKELEIVTNDMSGIPEALYAYGRERLKKEFESSAWFDSDASLSLLVAIKAGFLHEHTRTLGKAVHSYTVQVPYTVMIPQMRTIPHTTYQRMCTAYGCTSTPFTTYSYETYTVPITRYRDEPRQFKYDRWEHTQSLGFHAELLSLIQGKEAESSHTKTTNNTDTEHSHSVPDVGLHPDNLSLPDPLKWLENQIDESARNWGRALTRVWVQSYCTAPESTVNESALAEYVLRCLRDRREAVPAFTDTWFKEKMGADYQTAERWIDRVETSSLPSPDIIEVSQ